ncbi:MAG: monovalent cation/H(+) antiporter subunit G [Anaerolineae bacterium]|nr:monovalent cation/H(+) antiporter subunit G [Anaerolineae bacterium]
MRDWMAIICIFIGSAFMLISAIGVLRLPDLYLRMSASTKSSTLGVIFILLAAALFFDELSIVSRALAAIAFLLLTAPVAAHRMGRAAYFNGVPLWEGTRYNDLRGKYDQKTHKLAGPDGSIIDATPDAPRKAISS